MEDMGFHKVVCSVIQCMQEFDPSSGTVTRKADMNVGRGDAGLAVINDRIIAAGEHDGHR